MATFDLLLSLQKRSRSGSSLPLAAAVLAPLAAHLSLDQQEEFLSLLPPTLARSILLQLPTTSAYASLSNYVGQVANQEGIKREQAIVDIASVLSLLAPHLPASLQDSFGSDLTHLLRSS